MKKHIILQIAFAILIANTTKAQIITTIAGNGGIRGYNGDNIAATSAKLGVPMGVTVDKKGNLFF